MTSNAEIIRKIYFPRLIIPISGIGTALVDFLIAFVVFLAVASFAQFRISWTLALVPFIFVSVLIAAFGIGLLLAALMVTYRDFRYVIPYCLQVGFFLTPVIWWEEQVGELMGNWSILMYLNPVTGPLTAFRDVMTGQPIYWTGWMLSLAISVGVALFALAYFSRTEARFADVA